MKDNGQPHGRRVGRDGVQLQPHHARIGSDDYWFHTYIARRAERFREIAAAAGADVLIANHTIFDGSKQKLPALANRKPGDPNP